MRHVSYEGGRINPTEVQLAVTPSELAVLAYGVQDIHYGPFDDETRVTVTRLADELGALRRQLGVLPLAASSV